MNTVKIKEADTRQRHWETSQLDIVVSPVNGAAKNQRSLASNCGRLARLLKQIGFKQSLERLTGHFLVVADNQKKRS